MAENEPSYPLGQRCRFRPGALRSCSLIAALALLLGALRSEMVFGDEIDRLLASVNGRVVTEGDVELVRSLTAIVSKGQPATTTSRDDEIRRLIDLELMRQELAAFSASQEDESRVKARMQEFRSAWAGKGGLASFLSEFGLQENELISYLRLESSILRFVDFRFRPFVSVSDREIQTYYETTLVPQLREANAELPALTEIWGKIEELLREEKINVVLEQWIQEIRRNSRIERFDAVVSEQLKGVEQR